MPYKAGPLDPTNGAIVNVRIGVCIKEAQRRAALGQVTLALKAILAQIDSGASRSCVDLAVLQSDLGLLEIGRDTIHAPGGQAVLGTYVVDFLIDEGGGRHWNPFIVSGVDLTAFGFKAIVGRDILDESFYVHDGRAKTFYFSF